MKFASNMFILMLILLFSSSHLQADKLSLEDALHLGLENSPSLQSLRDNLAEIESSLIQIRGMTFWQVDIGGSASHVRDVRKQPPLLTDEDLEELKDRYPSIDDDWWDALKDSLAEDEIVETEVQKLEGKISASRYFPWGLMIRPEVTFTETDPFEFENPEENISFNLAGSMDLFPWIPTEPMQQLKTLEANLQRAQISLKFQQQQKLLEWLEDFLDIMRGQRQLELAELNQELASKQLEQTEKQKEAGEGGEQQVLAARIGLKQAEMQLQQTQSSLKMKKRAFYQDLGIPATGEFTFSSNDPLLQDIISRLEKFFPQEKDPEILLERVLATNPRYLASAMEVELLIEELNWKKTDLYPQVSLSGNYNYQKDAHNWSVGVNVSYNITDGRQTREAISSLENKLKAARREEDLVVADLKLQLENLLNQDYINQLNLETLILALERAELEEMLAHEQYNKGLINELSLQQKILARKQAQLDYLTAHDRLLISTLNLAHFLGLDQYQLGGIIK